VVWQLQWMRYLGYDPIYMIPVFPCCIYVSYRYALAVRAFDALAIEWLSYLWYGGYSGYVIWVMTQYIRYRSFLAAYMLVTVMLTRSLSCPCLCPSKIFDRIGVERRLCSNSTGLVLFSFRLGLGPDLVLGEVRVKVRNLPVARLPKMPH
jgi:hypothetical protein